MFESTRACGAFMKLLEEQLDRIDGMNEEKTDLTTKKCVTIGIIDGDGIIVGGSNYGQGASREHAALVPMYLGVRCVIAKSFARIHVANLINAGILPVTFANAEDYDKLNQDAKLTITNIVKGMEEGKLTVTDENGFAFDVVCNLTERQRAIPLAGGLLNYTKEGGL